MCGKLGPIAIDLPGKYSITIPQNKTSSFEIMAKEGTFIFGPMRAVPADTVEVMANI